MLIITGLFLLFCLLLLLYKPAAGGLPSRFEGHVVSVSDGDGLVVRPDGYKDTVRIRFLGIDAPETKQQFGFESKQILSRKIRGNRVTIQTFNVDKYGRRVSMVFVNGQDIGLSQIEDGAAWAFVTFRSVPADIASQYRQAEKVAKEKRIGLWGLNDVQEPWVWRKENAGWDGDRSTPGGNSTGLLSRLLSWILRILGVRA